MPCNFLFPQLTTRHWFPNYVTCVAQNASPRAFKRSAVQLSAAQCTGPITIPSMTIILTGEFVTDGVAIMG